MLKPIYGFKDAPKVWRKKLHKVLAQWQSCQHIYAEPELYCVHKWRPQRIKYPVGRAKSHDLQQQEIGSPRHIEPSKPTPGNLQCLLSVHVDDIKGTAPKAVAESLLAHLNASVGSCKADYGSFLHTGIQHEHSPGVVFTHQYVYVDSVKPISSDLYIGKEDEALCDAACHEAYRFVLGAVAWTVLTRTKLAIYVQALQRRAHAPLVTDCKRLNLAIRYMKKYKCGLNFVCLRHLIKLVGFIDVAFKDQPEEPTGLALRGLAATSQEDSLKVDQSHNTSGLANLVDFTIRRQRRVVRSTFSAELNGLVNNVEQFWLL